MVPFFPNPNKPLFASSTRQSSPLITTILPTRTPSSQFPLILWFVSFDFKLSKLFILSQLQLCAQVASFASTPDLSECVFQLRTLIHRNNSLLKAPSNKTLDAITSFAGEIMQKCQLLRERTKASKARASGAYLSSPRIVRTIPHL
jgi:hypothetical protein